MGVVYLARQTSLGRLVAIKVLRPGEQTYGLILVEFDGLPAEVEIRRETIDLPPAKARLLEEIKLLSPADGASFNLSEGFFRWSPLPGAATYTIQISAMKVDRPGSMSGGGYDYETEATTICMGVAPDQHDHLAILAREFVPGGLGEWTVTATDAAGRKVGAVVGGRRWFVVARGLERPKP